MTGVAAYDQLLAPSRQRFDSHRAIEALFRSPLDPVTLERFLIYFSALGVGMTEPVEDWIRRAGGRCRDLGMPDLAAALEAHAKHEADHHLLMQADTRRPARISTFRKHARTVTMPGSGAECITRAQSRSATP